MANTHDTMKNRPSTGGTTFSDKAGDMAAGATDKAQQATSGVADKARDIASGVADKARDIASGVGDRVTGATTSVGGGMRSLADNIRESAPGSGMLHDAGAAVADTLESGGRYLEQEGFSGIGQDLTNLVRRNPIPALFVGVAVGFLIARATSDRS